MTNCAIIRGWNNKHHTGRSRTAIQLHPIISSVVRHLTDLVQWLLSCFIITRFIYRYLSRAFQCRFASVLRGLTYYFRFGICRGKTRNLSDISGTLKTEYQLIIRLFGSWNGNIPAHPSHTRKQPVWAIRSTSLLLFNRRQDKVLSDLYAWRESVGITEAAMTANRTRKGGDEMIRLCRSCKHTDNWLWYIR